MQADVTVVIPVHDREVALRAALASVFAQTVQAARVVVVDDGSSDGSAAVAAEAGATVLRHGSPRGSGVARNTGIAAAETEWIAFLDSDDVWTPHHLEQAMASVGAHAFVTAPMVDSFGRGRGNVSGAVQAVTPDRLFFPENIVCTSTVVARRDAIEAVGAFSDLPRAQDLDLWIKLLTAGTAIALPRATAVYTQDEQYQEAGLRARSIAGASQVRSRYAAEPWMTAALSRSIDKRNAWDALRHAQHHGDRRGVLVHLRTLGVTPATASTLARVLLHRRQARRFADLKSA